MNTSPIAEAARAAQTALDRGELNKAMKALSSQMKLANFHRPEALELAAVAHRLAGALFKADQAEDGSTWAYQAYAMSLGLLPRVHELLVDRLAAVAIGLEAEGDVALASEYVAQALQMSRDVYGTKHARTVVLVKSLKHIQQAFNPKHPVGAKRIYGLQTMGAAGHRTLAFTEDDPEDDPSALGTLSLKLYDAAPLGDAMPKQLRFRLVKDSQVSDLVGNSSGVLIISKEFQALLRKQGAKFEAIPVQLLDAKGMVVSHTHSLIHPLEAIDVTHEKYRHDLESLESIEEEELIIDPRKAKKAPALFRAVRGKNELNLLAVFVNEPTAEAIRSKHFSNTFLREVRQRK